jgi:hypothetical protein
MDVSGRIRRAWMPAIYHGIAEAADGQLLRLQKCFREDRNYFGK